MKNKIYKRSVAFCFIMYFAALTGVKAQTVIYSQNFDSSSTSLPTGWMADPGGWAVDSTNTNSDTIAGVSQLFNVAIKNVTGLAGTFNLYSKTLSTVGYDSVNVTWDARLTKHFADSGSTIQGFYYSTDNGGSWINIPYAENSNNSVWSEDNDAARIKLPAGVSNQVSVEFKWVVVLVSTSSGTYRIDNFNVQGNALANGIKEYKDQDIFKVYVDGDKMLHFNAKPSFSLPSNSLVTISDVTGRVCFNERITENSNIYSLSEFKQGVYFVKITSASLLFTQKIVRH